MERQKGKAFLLNICKFFCIGIILLASHPLFAQQAKAEGKKSGISIGYWWSDKSINLYCGQTYTSSDFEFIKAGSITVSEDGKTLLFNHFNYECDDECPILVDFNNGFPYYSTLTISLVGENILHTLKGGPLIDCRGLDQLTITGDGSLSTQSEQQAYITGNISFCSYDNLPQCEMVIDNTTLSCEGFLAVSNSRNILVKNSRFEGSNLWEVDNLTMEGCALRYPFNGWFDKEDHYNIKDEFGYYADHFIISTLDDKTIPSNITFLGETLFCGHTYTSSDFPMIEEGSMSVSDNGRQLTFNNIQISPSSDSQSGSLFEVYHDHITVVLNGENSIKTSKACVMECMIGTLNITGNGSLTTSSNWYDFYIWSAGT